MQGCVTPIFTNFESRDFEVNETVGAVCDDVSKKGKKGNVNYSTYVLYVILSLRT